MNIERNTCAYCDMPTEYVLTVSDPAPEQMQVIDDSVSMPICSDHFEQMKEADMNTSENNNGTDDA